MESTTVAIIFGFIGFFTGGALSLTMNFSRKEDLLKSLSLYELTVIMATKMAAEEDNKTKSDRADRIRSEVREIVRKEFEA